VDSSFFRQENSAENAFAGNQDPVQTTSCITEVQTRVQVSEV